MKFDQDLCLNLQYDFGKMNSTLGSIVPLAMFFLPKVGWSDPAKAGPMLAKIPLGRWAGKWYVSEKISNTYFVKYKSANKSFQICRGWWCCPVHRFPLGPWVCPGQRDHNANWWRLPCHLNVKETSVTNSKRNICLSVHVADVFICGGWCFEARNTIRDGVSITPHICHFFTQAKS